MYSDTRTDVHADQHIEKKCVYISNNGQLNCGNGKNQRFCNNQFGSYNFYRNNLLQHKVSYKCFIYFVSRVN